MTLLEAFSVWLERQAGDGRLALVHDTARLVPLPERLPGGWTVLEAADELAFRRAYEPLRGTDQRLLVVRRAPNVMLADVEARVEHEGCAAELTPRALLAVATTRPWPAWLDRETALVHDCFPALVRLARRHAAEGDEALALRAALGLDLAAEPDAADVWQALAEKEAWLADLRRRRSPLAAWLQAWLERQAAPLRWFRLDDPSVAVRLTWLTAILQPYLPDVAELLPRLYPGAARLAGEDATAVARVAYRLARSQRKLAQAQLSQAEAVLAGPLRDALVRHLGLSQVDGAARLLRRERRSGLLLGLALRALLEAVGSDEAPHALVLEPDLAALLPRSRDFTHAEAVAEQAGLLRALLRLDRARRRIAEVLDEAPAEALVPRAVALLVDTEVGTLDADLQTAARLMTRNAACEPSWHPRPSPERHKHLMRAWYHGIELARVAQARFERALADAVVAGRLGEGSARVVDAWPTVVTPLLSERLTVVLVSGLSHEGWERSLAPQLAAAWDQHSAAWLAPLPTAGALACRRAFAAERWESGRTALPWSRLARLARPELELRSARVPTAFAGQAAAGLVVWSGRGPRLRLVVLDLLAGAAGGVPVSEYERRRDALGHALAELAASRRDDCVVVLGTSGAVRCHEHAGLALEGQALAPRALLASGEPPADVAVLEPRRCGLPGGVGEQVWVTTGRERLAPAARGAVYADGGLASSELTVPVAVLTPVPAGERSAVQVGELVLPETVVAGASAAAVLPCTLVGGALAEVVEVTLEGVDAGPVQAVLDAGERRSLLLSFTATLPPGVSRGTLTVSAVCRVGRRVFRRRAVCALTAAVRVAPATTSVVVEG